MTDLPTFVELAQAKLAYAGPRDKTINIKISINTARMMVEADPDMRKALKIALAALQGKCGEAFRDLHPVTWRQMEAALDKASRAPFTGSKLP